MGEVKKTGSDLTVSVIPHTDEGKAQDITGVSTVLWAIGRDANTVNLGIDKTGVALSKRGFIEVDEYQNTNVSNVYALGDIAGNKLLTPGMCVWGCVFACMLSMHEYYLLCVSDDPEDLVCDSPQV